MGLKSYLSLLKSYLFQLGWLINPSVHITCVSVEEVENGLSTFLYIRTTGFITKTGHRQQNLGSSYKNPAKQQLEQGQIVWGGHSTIQTMKVRAQSGPSSCTQHAAHRDCPIIPTDTACLATQNAPANRPDPMQPHHRAPTREPLR